MKRKKILLFGARAILILLILLQLNMIFGFSAQPAAKSDETSRRISEDLAKITVKDYETLEKDEQEQIVKRINPPVRKTAHAAEFAVLGTLFFLFFCTFYWDALLCYAASLVAVLVFAAADEFHQTFVNGRSGEWRDVLIDFAGALAAGAVLLLVGVILQRKFPKLRVTRYLLPARVKEKIAFVSDLHRTRPEPVLGRLAELSPDLILVGGDILNKEQLSVPSSRGFAFLRGAAAIAPTYYILGNHEIGCYRRGLVKKRIPRPLTDAERANIEATGVHLLENAVAKVGSLSLCGLTSQGHSLPDVSPDLREAFDRSKGFHILLLHQPEQFAALSPLFPALDLTLSGHAHGGQWDFFGHGTFSPGQGIFPKYTAGFYFDKKLLISRGLGDSTIIPRIHNPREILLLEAENE